MGLSLQLFVNLSKVLSQHSDEDLGPEIARKLIELIKLQRPDLLDRNDPNNVATPIISAYALGMGLDRGAAGSSSSQRLVISNALSWLTRKVLTPVAIAGAAEEDVRLLEWAKLVNEVYLSSTDEETESESEQAWKPSEAPIRVRSEVTTLLFDPMLVPDVPLPRIRRAPGPVPSHLPHASNPLERRISRATSRSRSAKSESATGDAASRLMSQGPGRMMAGAKDVADIVIKWGTKTEHMGPLETPSEGLILVTGTENSRPGDMSGAVPNSPLGGMLVVMGMASLIAPPLALLCARFAWARGNPRAGLLMLGLGGLGWFGWSTILGRH
jgi:hypothetical protein